MLFEGPRKEHPFCKPTIKKKKKKEILAWTGSNILAVRNAGQQPGCLKNLYKALKAPGQGGFQRTPPKPITLSAEGEAAAGEAGR